MFHPPRCPYIRCRAHTDPTPRFCRSKGYYHPKCRPHPIPRFTCKHCHRSFSRQTFRQDYHDHYPHLNAELYRLLCSGMGLRQSARLLKLSVHGVQLKFRKIARHLWHLHRNLTSTFRDGVEFQLDEMETYEGRRNTRPLTLPVLIESRSMFIVSADCAPIRPSGRMSESRKKAIEEEEKRSGPRKDESRPCIRGVMEDAARHCRDLDRVRLRTDEKKAYPPLARQLFGARRLVHRQFSSKLPRDKDNPLFKINLTNAMARDLNGRLRRKSWLVSKMGKYLRAQLAYFITYRNYVRRRFNEDEEEDTPAALLGFVKGAMRVQQLLSWRQSWGKDSIHPLCRRKIGTVSEIQRQMLAAS
jgi:transposase-like protein